MTTDNALAAIRSVTDRALAEIDPEATRVSAPLSSDQDLLLQSLATRSDPGGIDISGARLRTIRRVLLKLMRPSTEFQWGFNADVRRALLDLMTESRTRRSELDSTRAELASLELQAEADRREIHTLMKRVEVLDRQMARKVDTDSAHELEVRLAALAGDLRGQLLHESTRVEEFETVGSDLRAQLERTRGDLDRHRAVLDMALRELRSARPDDAPDLSAVTRPLDESFDTFYQDLESALRGSRDQVMKSQRDYLNLVRDLPGPLLDIGPGRGEWLELLLDSGLEASGVDINALFVEECASRGLDVVHADAFDHLRSTPEGSLGAVTAFQVVEHLPFEALVDLLALCFVALKPGGVLIFETPNPSNLKVGAMSFWNDPSHVHPLPPHMLEFLVQWRGFVDVVIRFPEHPAPRSLDIGGAASRELDDINWAMFGPEDYAIVARRP